MTDTSKQERLNALVELQKESEELGLYEPKQAELLPCPFCGKPGLLQIEEDHHGETFNLGCSVNIHESSKCPGALVQYTQAMEELPNAIAAWNQRHPSTREVLVEVLEETKEYQRSMFNSNMSEPGIAILIKDLQLIIAAKLEGVK